jgi:hypothetical protein
LLGKDQQNEREFKVRIVEKLTYLDQRLNNSHLSNAPGGQLNDSEEALLHKLAKQDEESAPSIDSNLIQDE